MRLLITNDDGIHAPGLEALIEVFCGKADIMVVAPDVQRSAASHALTFLSPIRITYKDEKPGLVKYAINGTPVDCVVMALFHLMPEPPDLIISGINSGANMGYDIVYSGTVAAAMEGAIHGFKALAVSLNGRHPQNFGTAATLAQRLVQRLDDIGADLAVPEQTLYNLNVPDLPLADIKGVRFTYQGLSIYNQFVDPRQDPWNRDYYWLSGEQPRGQVTQGSDFQAVYSDYASLTPIQVDCTNYEVLRRWQDRLGSDLLDEKPKG